MQELSWLESHFGGNLKNGIDRINDLKWNLSITKEEGENSWCIFAGESLLYKSVSQESIDVFLYGMGLAYIVLPDDIFTDLKDAVENL